MEPLSLTQLEGSNNTIPLSETQAPTATKPASQRATSTDADGKPRRMRQRWTKEETDDLIKGCATWGVGNWKRILGDPSLKFYNRTSVDLKDRFRTYFPEDYKRLYPNATSTRERATPQPFSDQAANFSKTRRKDRNPFTKEEDDNLLIGFGRYQGKWSMIQKDATLELGHRRPTDLRDRFRNAFPDKYVGAGFKAPPARKRRRTEEEEAETRLLAAEETVLSTALVEETSTTQQQPAFQVVEEAVAAATAPVVVLQERREPVVPVELGFTNTRLPTATTSTSWANNPHNTARAKEAEMVAKLRAALDMESAMEDAGEIPLDPGLSDVAYQPSGQSENTEALTGLLDAPIAPPRRKWRRN